MNGETPRPAQVGDENTAPTTTAADDLRTSGQRLVNLIWEGNQAIIALFVVGVVLTVAGLLALMARDPAITDKQMAISVTAFMLLSNIVSLIIGFYFGRTNHQKTAGVEKGDIGR